MILGTDWTEATASAAWAQRNGHTSVVYNGKIWVMGGDAGGFEATRYNDVWSSIDGVTWTQATSSAGWDVRVGLTSVVYDGKMWVMGGLSWGDFATRNDVWYSTDGVTWTQATASAGWAVRGSHASVVHNDKIWVMGGRDSGGTYKNDVWYSTNGGTWTQATSAAGWSTRYSHTSIVQDGRIWVLGGRDSGGYKRDVWSSADGVTWTQATVSAGWSTRYGHSSVVYGNKMWVVGGFTGSAYINDVWYSLDYVPTSSATETALLDSSTRYASIVEQTIFGGLWHLNGRAVGVVVDGVYIGSQVVNNGKIVLGSGGKNVHIGLVYTGRLLTNRFDYLNPEATHGLIQRVIGVVVSVTDSGAFKYGTNTDNLDTVVVKDFEGDVAERLTGDIVDRAFPGRFIKDSSVLLVQDQPIPTTINAIILEVEIGIK